MLFPQLQKFILFIFLPHRGVICEEGPAYIDRMIIYVDIKNEFSVHAV